ncbi:exo-alpha-sialidase [Aestuariirhabdus sp. Z084]|uniref:sialidase family protein n=1 Tax=Aestuariirhabdus haliotis TaxID=2918751 RepID=UPI0020C13CB0|nr:sialidase family protein [Aestuariirhabdus haliotis]MCL6414649.1 exo-alpha-sialidase [Aestuariirhabdus haliotis]
MHVADNRLLPAVLVMAVFLMTIWLAPGLPSGEFAQTEHAFGEVVLSSSNEKGLIDERMASDGQTIMVHAPTLVELPDGRLMAAWFGGSREGAQDVKIYGAYYDLESGIWSASFALVDPATTSHGTRRFIKKMGNPVLFMGPDSQLWLLYVSVSVGGWATSHINLIKSADLGQHWGDSKRLVTAPFLNLSSLVKGVPFQYADGSVGIPAYHEFAGKFGEILRLDRQGSVIDKVRLAKGRDSLQPIILASSKNQADAYLRYAGDKAPYRVLRVSSDDGGIHWSNPVKIPIPNPNSAIAGFRALGKDWLIGNDTEDERDRLTLMLEGDEGEGWGAVFELENSSHFGGNSISLKQFDSIITEELEDSLDQQPLREQAQSENFAQRARVEMCEQHGCYFQYDYPYAIRTANGDVHLLYTWNKSAVKHIRFNEAWLKDQLP